MTNEEILIIYLKSKRKFSAFKRNVLEGSRIREVSRGYSCNVLDAIDRAFIWGHTPEGDDYWYDISNEWEELCNNFSIDSPIILKKVIEK